MTDRWHVTFEPSLFSSGFEKLPEPIPRLYMALRFRASVSSPQTSGNRASSWPTSQTSFPVSNAHSANCHTQRNKTLQQLEFSLLRKRMDAKIG